MHQLVELKWLRDEIRRAALDGINGVLHGAETSNDDRDDARIPLPGRLDHSGPVDARQPEVGDDDVERELVEELEGPFAAVGLHDLESALGQPLGHQSAERGLVVDKQEMGGGAHLGGANILTQASLRIGAQQPIQLLEVVSGPCGPFVQTFEGRLEPRPRERIWTARPSLS